MGQTQTGRLSRHSYEAILASEVVNDNFHIFIDVLLKLVTCDQ